MKNKLVAMVASLTIFAGITISQSANASFCQNELKDPNWPNKHYKFEFLYRCEMTSFEGEPFLGSTLCLSSSLDNYDSYLTRSYRALRLSDESDFGALLDLVLEAPNGRITEGLEVVRYGDKIKFTTIKGFFNKRTKTEVIVDRKLNTAEIKTYLQTDWFSGFNLSSSTSYHCDSEL